MTERTLKDRAAIVGVGATPYYRRGRSLPQTPMELASKAVLAALDDAGLTVDDLDGFALYSMALRHVAVRAVARRARRAVHRRAHRRRRRRGRFGRARARPRSSAGMADVRRQRA